MLPYYYEPADIMALDRHRGCPADEEKREMREECQGRAHDQEKLCNRQPSASPQRSTEPNSITNRWFPDAKTKTTHAALLRAIGFSSAPGIIRVFSFTPELMTVTFIGSALWMLACMVVAVRQTLNFKSLWKALGVVVMSWFVQAFALISILALTRNF